jgi:hypothetical protein
MSAAFTASVDDPPLAGGAVPGVALLRIAQRFMKAGMAFARSVTRIAQHKLMGEDLSRLAPAGFDATATDALVVEAVAWTVALRERLRALAGRPLVPLVPGVPGVPKAERAPQARGAAKRVTVSYQAAPGDPHNWPALAKPWRIGPTGVAKALEQIEGKSNREVVSHICDFLRRAAMRLGAEADLPRLAALEAAARALCPEDEAAPDAAAGSGTAKAAPGACAAGPPSGEPPSRGPQSRVDDDPPKQPPDG